MRRSEHQYLVTLAFVSALILAVAIFVRLIAPGQVAKVSAMLVAATFALLVIAAIAQRYQRTRMRHAAAAARGVVHERTDDSSRLQCVGLPQWIAAQGELHSEPFEPQIFRAISGLPANPRGGGLVAAAVIVCYLVAPLFNYLITSRWLDGVFLYSSALFFAAVSLASLFYPTYVRVVPGRMDLLHYALFRKPIVETVDLRQAMLVVDLTLWHVTVRPNNSAKPLEFSIGLVRGRARLAYMLSLAALSPHTPPPIEGDGLVG